MYFTKVFLILVIATISCLNLTQAGQQAGKVGQEALKTVGGALKQGSKKLPHVLVGGYAANSTLNVNVNTKPHNGPGSPSGDKQKSSHNLKARR